MSLKPLLTGTAMTLLGAGASGFKDRLISVWHLEEASGTRFDAFGSNHLTANNTPSNQAGILGNAVALVSGSSQSLSIVDNGSLSVEGQSFSVSAWVNPTVAGLAAGGNIVGKDNNSAGNREWHMVFNPAGLLVARLQNSTTNVLLVTDGTLGSLAWQHCVFTYDATSLVGTLYRNATNVNTASASAQVTASGASFQMGAGVSGNLDGAVDEVGFWKRVLSAGEVAQLYNAGLGALIV